MNSEQTAEIQVLLERVRRGGAAAARQAAARGLVGRAYQRLRGLARRILRRDFPRFDGRRDSDSVLNEAVVRLLPSLEQVRPATCRDFFNLAATQIRRVLLDAARREGRGAAAGPPGGGAGPACPGDDPGELEAWAEFHRRVEVLPPREREGMALRWYHGLTQARVAEVLGISPRMVSHHWARACRRLAAALPDRGEKS
jgi:RNA polymerase sigma factor (sigma-70 family)